jgi:hypothetical protein
MNTQKSRTEQTLLIVELFARLSTQTRATWALFFAESSLPSQLEQTSVIGFLNKTRVETTQVKPRMICGISWRLHELFTMPSRVSLRFCFSRLAFNWTHFCQASIWCVHFKALSQRMKCTFRTSSSSVPPFHQDEQSVYTWRQDRRCLLLRSN